MYISAVITYLTDTNLFVTLLFSFLVLSMRTELQSLFLLHKVYFFENTKSKYNKILNFHGNIFSANTTGSKFLLFFFLFFESNFHAIPFIYCFVELSSKNYMIVCFSAGVFPHANTLP